jgi:hypothetical protein
MPKFLIILWDRIDVGTYDTREDAETEIAKRLFEHEGPARDNPYTIREVADAEFRPCAICGAHCTSPEVDFCRTCYQSGAQAEREFAPMLADVAKLDNVAEAPQIWNSGGGCFILEINLKDGRCVWATDAFEEGGEWHVESGVPEKPEGPWSVVVGKDAESLHEGDVSGDGLQEFIPVWTADFAQTIASL